MYLDLWSLEMYLLLTQFIYLCVCLCMLTNVLLHVGHAHICGCIWKQEVLPSDTECLSGMGDDQVVRKTGSGASGSASPYVIKLRIPIVCHETRIFEQAPKAYTWVLTLTNQTHYWQSYFSSPEMYFCLYYYGRQVRLNA